MKTIYINEKGKITKRKIRKITKKICKINKKEEIAVAICKELTNCEELIEELEDNRIMVLNR